MKKLGWIIISIVGFILLTLGIALTLILTLGISWWWFGGLFITYIVLGAIGLLIGLGIFISKKRKQEPTQVDLSDVKQRAIYDMKYDKDNADNFVINNDREVWNIGEKGATPTPVSILRGYGSELQEKRVVVTSMVNPEKKSMLINPSEEKILETATKIADYPPQYITEIQTTSYDDFGRPMPQKEVRKPSYREQQEQKEKDEAEQKEAM